MAKAAPRAQGPPALATPFGAPGALEPICAGGDRKLPASVARRLGLRARDEGTTAPTAVSLFEGAPPHTHIREVEQHSPDGSFAALQSSTSLPTDANFNHPTRPDLGNALRPAPVVVVNQQKRILYLQSKKCECC
ncbi:Protein of unknown function [Gryllus bimaculatus]|nr:Protein of unknown function [Gryllus bimaculatus]